MSTEAFALADRFLLLRRVSSLILFWLLLLPSLALSEDVGVRPVADALAVVRATPASDNLSAAGPELAPVKRALRQWVEASLAAFPNDGDEAALAKRLNDAAAFAGLTCDLAPTSRRRCVDPGDAYEENARGYIGDLELERQEHGQYLIVKTNVGIRCGYDESVYVYEWREGAWRILLESEQNRYGKGEYQPQNFLSVLVSPANATETAPAPPPLILTLGTPPACASAWHALYTRLWRTARANPSPKPILDVTDSLYLGDDPAVANASITQDDVLIEFRSNSIDSGKLVRPVVRHYLVGKGDKLERIAPVALNPDDFVDEWLTRDRRETLAWADSSKDRVILGHWRRVLHRGDVFGEFDGPAKRCRADPTLWQVGFAFDVGGDKDYRLGPPAYFLVRWTAPYRFTLVRIQRRRFAGCTRADPMPDNLGTLFPLQDWR